MRRVRAGCSTLGCCWGSPSRTLSLLPGASASCCTAASPPLCTNWLRPAASLASTWCWGRPAARGLCVPCAAAQDSPTLPGSGTGGMCAAAGPAPPTGALCHPALVWTLCRCQAAAAVTHLAGLLQHQPHHALRQWAVHHRVQRRKVRQLQPGLRVRGQQRRAGYMVPCIGGRCCCRRQRARAADCTQQPAAAAAPHLGHDALQAAARLGGQVLRRGLCRLQRH